MAKRGTRLTEAKLTRAPAGRTWDGATPGFGIHKAKSGRVAFIVKYRDESRRQRFVTLGYSPSMTLSEARQRAEGIAARGGAGRSAKSAQGGTRVADVADRYFRSGRFARLAPSTQSTYISTWNGRLQSVLGDTPMLRLTAGMVEKTIHGIIDDGHPYAAFQSRAVLQAVMKQAAAECRQNSVQFVNP